MGAGKWRAEYAEVMCGTDVVIVADRDEPGRKHAREVAASLRGVARSVEIREPAEGKDLADHLAEGLLVEELVLVQLTRETYDSGSAASEDDTLGAGGPEPEEQSKLRSYLVLAPTREQLAALAASPPIVPVATHLLYPQTTTVLAGQTGLGKTTSVIRVAVDLIYGREPWTGRHDGRDPLCVLIVSKDDTTLSIVRKVVALAPDDTWMDGRLLIIGKEKRALVLDDEGVEVLGNTIADGRFDAFIFDPYQHFLPAGLTVNDGDKIVKWELAGPPTNAEAEKIRARLLDLEPGTYSVTALARIAFEIAKDKTPSGPRRTDAKRWGKRLAEWFPERFVWREKTAQEKAGLEVLDGDDPEASGRDSEVPF